MDTSRADSTMDLPKAREGAIYNSWTLVERVDKRRWKARCSCGTERNTLVSNILDGRSKSCGCASKGRPGHRFVHGLSRTRCHAIWSRMWQRCTNPEVDHYAYYGGRGIRVCERWKDFLCFLEDMGHPPEACSIERIDHDGDYEPTNCRWATRKEQARNTRATRWIELDGQRKSVAEWAEIGGLDQTTLGKRLRRGWPVREAIYLPLGSRI